MKSSILRRQFFNPATIPEDLSAGLVLGIQSIPDGQLPKVTENSRHAVVILGLRGETELGSTFLEVLTRYGEALRHQESLLMLVGVAPSVRRQLERTGMLRSLGRENVFLSNSLVGYGLQESLDAAEAWIAARSVA